MVGEPDGLERLWTPHRMAYVSGDVRPASGYDTPQTCPFCLAPALSEEDGLVVARGDAVYAVLNRFPYNPGHLLICPYRHVADYPDLDEAETNELARFSQTAMRVIRTVSGPSGFNLGMNQGGVAGAGIAAHLHQHIVPRWSGDTNFMPVIGRTRTLPQLLVDTRTLLADAWEAEEPPRRSRRRPAPVAAPAKRAPAPAAAKRTAAAEATKRGSVAEATKRGSVAEATKRGSVAGATKRNSAAAPAKRGTRATGNSTVEPPAPARTSPARRRSG